MDISDFARSIVGRTLGAVSGRFYVSADGEESELPISAWLAFSAPVPKIFQLQTRGDGGLAIAEVGSIPKGKSDLKDWGSAPTKSIGEVGPLIGYQFSGAKLILVPVDGVVGFSASTSDGASLWVANIGDNLHVGIGNPMEALPGAEINMISIG